MQVSRVVAGALAVALALAEVAIFADATAMDGHYMAEFIKFVIG